MAFIDYYKILGVDKNIPQKDVKKAYLKRAKQFHPDLHPDDPKAKAKFQALTEAYDVIGDPAKRAKYDQYGQQWKQAEQFGGYGGGAGGGNPFGGFDFSSSSGGGGFSDFFETLFGRKGQQGGGFGGCTINLVANELYDNFVKVVKEKYAAKYGKEPIVIDVVIGDGSRKLC